MTARGDGAVSRRELFSKPAGPSRSGPVRLQAEFMVNLVADADDDDADDG